MDKGILLAWNLAAACIAWPCAAQSFVPPTFLPRPPLYRTIDGETDGQRWREEYWSYSHLAAVRCVLPDGAPLLRYGTCRYKDYTGELLTYHPEGTVSEVLHLTNGVLDGLSETYDPQGKLLERVYYRQGVGVSSDGQSLPIGQRLGAAEPRPELWPQAPGTTPNLGSPAPMNDIRGAGPPGRYLARPPFRIMFELGMDLPIVCGFGPYNTFTEVGPVSQFHMLIHVQRWLITEFNFGWLPNWGLSNRGYDWPLLRMGLRLPLGHGKVAPYLLSGVSMTAGQSMDLGTDPDNPVTENAFYLGVDGGMGIAWHFAGSGVMSVDARFGRNFRVDRGPYVMMPDDSGVLQEVMGSYYFLVTNIGLGVQF